MTTGVRAEHGLHLLRQMVLIRRFEERCAQAYSEQKIRGFVHLSIGEEAVAAGVMEALAPADTVISTYREHGHALARGISPNAVMAEMYGKREGCSRGRGGSMHLFDAAARFYGGNAIVAAGLPLALGFALAEKLRNGTSIPCCFFGEGAVAEGEFHESMNLAALWSLPALFVCENNLYAMGTRYDRSESVTDLRQKAAAYGIAEASVDGMDVEAVEAAARDAVTFARTQRRPFLLECRTYRFRAHSMYDPELYRSKAEVETWKARDPLVMFSARLKERGEASDDDAAQVERDVAEAIDAAVAFAEAGTPEPLADLTRFVVSERRP